MKAILVAAVTWTTTVAGPPKDCPSESDLLKMDKFSSLEPFLSERGKHFMLGKIGNVGVLLARNRDGLYCQAVSMPDEVWKALAQRYKSFSI